MLQNQKVPFWLVNILIRNWTVLCMYFSLSYCKTKENMRINLLIDHTISCCVVNDQCYVKVSCSPDSNPVIIRLLLNHEIYFSCWEQQQGFGDPHPKTNRKSTFHRVLSPVQRSAALWQLFVVGAVVYDLKPSPVLISILEGSSGGSLRLSPRGAVITQTWLGAIFWPHGS